MVDESSHQEASLEKVNFHPVIGIDRIIDDLATDITAGRAGNSQLDRAKMWDKCCEAQQNYHAGLLRFQELAPIVAGRVHRDDDGKVIVLPDGGVQISLLDPEKYADYPGLEVEKLLLQKLGVITAKDDLYNLTYSESGWKNYGEEQTTSFSTGGMQVEGYGTPQAVDGLGVRLVAKAPSLEAARSHGFTGFQIYLTMNSELASKVKEERIEGLGNLVKQIPPKFSPPVA